MSGCTEEIKCPNCGGEAKAFSETKPFDFGELECVHCGLVVTPAHSYMSLDVLNELRSEQDPPLEPLTELPEHKFKLWG